MTIILLSTILSILSFGPIQPEDITAKQISENAILLTAQKGFWRVNSVVVKTNEGLVIIDTFPSPEFAKIALEHIKKFTNEPVRLIINTHCHADHCFGNKVFSDATIIGHQKCIAELSAEPERISHGVSGAIKRYEERLRTVERGSETERKINDMLDFLRHLDSLLAEGFEPTPPNLLISGNAALSLGDVTFQIFYTGVIHSESQLAVYIPGEGILVTSGLFHANYLPVLNADSGPDGEKLLYTLIEIVDACSDAISVVPGHDEVCTIEDLKAQLDYLRELNIAVEASFRQGKSIEQACEEIKLDKFESFANYKEVHTSNIKEEWKRLMRK